MSKDHLLPPSASRLPELKVKKTYSTAPQYSADHHNRTSSMYYSDNVDSNEGMREFLDTVAVVPKVPKIPNIYKYLRKRKTSKRNKTNSDGDIIQNDL